MKHLLLALCIASTLRAPGDAPAPNFIVILADDLGWGSTSAQIDPALPESKSDYFQTPNLERLSASGLRFTQAYAAHCNCSPTRASLQTGRSPASLRFTDILERPGGVARPWRKLTPPRQEAALAPTEDTLPELLKKHNSAYRAAHYGKWHLGSGGPAAHGYDDSDGATTNAEGRREANLPDDPKRAFSITQRAIAFVRKNSAAKTPFYLQVSHYAPHLNAQSRPASLAKFDALEPGARHTNAKLAAMLADLDTAVGQLLDAVQEAGIADHTYLIFTSDNGGNVTDDPGNVNGPLRGWKCSLWEGGLRVPFFVAGPGITPGGVSRVPVATQDILPTICELADQTPTPKDLDGVSFRSILGRPDAALLRARPLLFHWPHYQIDKGSLPATALLVGDFKLHYAWESGEVQLYDLSRDLAETTDLASKHPAKAAELKALMLAELKESNAQTPSPNSSYDPQAVKPGASDSSDDE